MQAQEKVVRCPADGCSCCCWGVARQVWESRGVARACGRGGGLRRLRGCSATAVRVLWGECVLPDATLIGASGCQADGIPTVMWGPMQQQRPGSSSCT